jgi:hypothetical protein
MDGLGLRFSLESQLELWQHCTWMDLLMRSLPIFTLQTEQLLLEVQDGYSLELLCSFRKGTEIWTNDQGNSWATFICLLLLSIHKLLSFRAAGWISFVHVIIYIFCSTLHCQLHQQKQVQSLTAFCKLTKLLGTFDLPIHLQTQHHVQR